MEGIIVAIICILGFLATAGFVVYKILQGPKLPKGHVYKIKKNNNEITLVVDDKLAAEKKDSGGKPTSWFIEKDECSVEDLLNACAKSVECTEAAFADNGIEKADEERFIFYFATDDVFENLRGPANVMWAKGVAAWSEIKSGMFGTNKTPAAIMRTKYMNDVIGRGQPLIHELVHILNRAASGDYSHNHTDSKLWLGPGGEKSVEGIAAKRFETTV